MKVLKRPRKGNRKGGGRAATAREVNMGLLEKGNRNKAVKPSLGGLRPTVEEGRGSGVPRRESGC